MANKNDIYCNKILTVVSDIQHPNIFISERGFLFHVEKEHTRDS